MGLGSYFRFGLPQGLLCPDDARNFSSKTSFHAVAKFSAIVHWLVGLGPFIFSM